MVDIPVEAVGTAVSEVLGAVDGSGADAAAKLPPDSAGDGAAPMDVTPSDSTAAAPAAAAAVSAPPVAAGETAEDVSVVAADASRVAAKRPEPEVPTAATAPEPAAKKPRGTTKTAAGAEKEVAPLTHPPLRIPPSYTLLRAPCKSYRIIFF